MQRSRSITAAALSVRTVALVGLLLAAVEVAGCGGSSSSKSSSSTTSASSSTTTTTPPPAAKLVQRVRVVGAAEGATPVAKAGSEFVVDLRTPSTAIGKQLTVSIKQAGGGFAVHSAVKGTPLSETDHIKTSTGGLKVVSLKWECEPPSGTFCPVTPEKSSGTNVQVRLKGSALPIEFIGVLDHPGAETVPPLTPLAPPAPGAAVTATIKVATVSSGAKLTLATAATARAGAEVAGVVRIAPASPANATLHISIPNTSGKTITIHAGGTNKSPSSTATITSETSSPIRVASFSYTCGLPPYTFCPMNVKQTNTGLNVTLPTPRVPVVFKLVMASG